jgi:hypothetical protein
VRSAPHHNVRDFLSLPGCFVSNPIDQIKTLEENLDRDLKKLIESLPEGDERRKLERIREDGRRHVAHSTDEDLAASGARMLSKIKATRSQAEKEAEKQFAELAKINSQFEEISVFGQKQRHVKAPWLVIVVVIGIFVALLVHAVAVIKAS